MDKEYSEDLLEDLEALTDMHSQFMSPEEYISQLLSYALHVTFMVCPNLEIAESAIKAAIEEGIENYKKGLDE